MTVGSQTERISPSIYPPQGNYESETTATLAKEIGIRAQQRKKKKNTKGKRTKKKAAEQGSVRKGRTG